MSTANHSTTLSPAASAVAIRNRLSRDLDELTRAAKGADTLPADDNGVLFDAQPFIAANGTLTFTPAPNANGSATITIQLRDNGGTANGGQDTSAPQSFMITVTPVNDAPIVTSDVATTNEDTSVTIAVLTNDNNAADGGTLNPASVLVTSGPSNGTTSVNATSGDITYTPNATFNGGDSFTYQVCDNGIPLPEACGSATVNITINAVNDAPTVNVSGGQCNSDTSAAATLALTVGDVETAAVNLTVSATSSNQTLIPNDTLVVGGSGANRTLTLTGAPKQSGTAIITVKVSDGTDTTTRAITVRVGTPKDDTLTGTADPDILFGLGGKNTLNGAAGNDLLCGGSKGDTLNGGNGDDVLDGGGGNDLLSGGGGNDTLTGGTGADFFSGGAGTDTAIDFNAAEGDTQDGSIP